MNSKDREKARLARNAYHRAWRARNKEKVKEINDRYWVKRAEKEGADGESNSEPVTSG